MAEFQEVIRQWRRMCADGKTVCRGLPDEDEAKTIEGFVMAWAAEHPEPVYPTWYEWLADKGMVDVARIPDDCYGGIRAAGFSVEYIATRMDKGISACYYGVKKQRKAGAIAKRPTRRATQAERKMAIDLYKAGEKVSRISAQTGLLVSVISRILTDAGLVGDPHEPRMMMCGYCTKFSGVRFDHAEGIVGTCAETGEARQRCDECKCGKPDYKEGYWCLFKGQLIRATTNR